MNRRGFLRLSLVAGLILVAPRLLKAGSERSVSMIEKIEKTDAEWRNILTDAQFDVLRNEGTEPPFSSDLNKQYGKGVYHCAGCDLELFSSETKFDSGTGWPSFYAPIEGHVETRRDFKLILPRTEYHCARCGGHQGHVFKDGPEPTGLRYCNNGVALKFIAA
ncbi:peptide-methionine (R)-S-oxide reductase MsrB [Mariprofundus sp. NF]|uniref:peptide-methionine (R)-S-oxide reductase MsrB n=1 Tax=Mariprofundus sp. NF TaxID=2608716 RepID=UPI0015A01526|nr:peptide-methionine (R)-S-oxide reductase MsrB [Mariprofundus sp. NF]NWF38488.1 peptide-methionine (R)-S-oxide reductase MsrB [Mariprofundus sp. NF]